MTTVCGCSQSNGDINLGNWSNSSIKSSSPVKWCYVSWTGRLFSCHHSLHYLILHILLIKVHYYAESPASSVCYTSPLICLKRTSWHPYLLTHPYLILLVVMSGMTLFLLGTYCCLFCCCRNYLCSYICVFLVLLAYYDICYYHYSYIHIASGVLLTCSIGLSSLQPWFHWYLMHPACWICLYGGHWLTHIPHQCHMYPWSIPPSSSTVHLYVLPHYISASCSWYHTLLHSGWCFLLKS